MYSKWIKYETQFSTLAMARILNKRFKRKNMLKYAYLYFEEIKQVDQ